MQIKKKKFLFKLIAALCLIITLFNVTGQNKVYAKSEYWGGVLIDPVVNLLTAIGDALIEIMHKSIQSQNIALIKIDSASGLDKVVAYIAAALAFLIVAVAFIAITGGVGAGIIAGGFTEVLTEAAIVNIAIQTATIAAVGGTLLGVTAATGIKQGIIPDDLYLPMFSISPEEIFSDSIALFDVNFFNVDPEKYFIYNSVKKDSENVDTDNSTFNSDAIIWSLKNLRDSENEEYKTLRDELNEFEDQTVIDVSSSSQVLKNMIIEKVNEKLDDANKITEDMKIKIYKKKPEDTNDRVYLTTIYKTEEKYVLGIMINDKEYLYIKYTYITTITNSPSEKEPRKIYNKN